MTGWLLDTNVLSELRRPKPDAKVVQFISGQPLDLLYISVVTFAEIRFGIELVKEVSRRMELNEWLEHKLRPMFEDRFRLRWGDRRHRTERDEAWFSRF